jgi:NADPH:quinone reductase-like Zn-dependent oxidoreductase
VTSAVVARITSRQRVIVFSVTAGSATLQRLAALTASGALRPHIERRITLEDTAGAQRAMESAHGRGKVVVVP